MVWCGGSTCGQEHLVSEGVLIFPEDGSPGDRYVYPLSECLMNYASEFLLSCNN